MTNALIVPHKAGQLYAKMQTAITECHSVDDCKQIADQASAIAAYFKQIKDDESVRRFFAVKLRAWRRIGEILATVDGSDCETQTAYINKIRICFKDDQVIADISDWYLVQSLKVAKLPQDFFDDALGRYSNMANLLTAYQNLLDEQWRESPEGKAAAKRSREEIAESERRTAEWHKKSQEKAHEEAMQKREEEAELLALAAARDAAFDEVGVTFDRRDRKQMREVIFLIGEPVHERLRQAAFDKRMTMQAVLRAGLAMWFFANGYDTTMGDEDFQPRKRKAA